MNVSFVETLGRFAHLLGLCVAPRALSPEPASPSAALGAVLLLALLAGAGASAKWGKGLGRAPAVLLPVAVVAALVASARFAGPQAPLARGVLFVAPLVWLGLASAVAAGVERFAVKQAKARAAAALALTLGAGVALVVPARGLLRDPAQMWARALALDPGHESAVGVVVANLRAGKKLDEARGVADKCVTAKPTSCGCRTQQARAELDLGMLDAALEHAKAGTLVCPDSGPLQALLADVLVRAGKADEALSIADRALGGSAGARAELHEARGRALLALGRTDDARKAVEAALAAGGGRTALLLGTVAAIGAKDFDGANGFVDRMLALDKGDADAVYNRGYIADVNGNFNLARTSYLAALKLEPDYAVARFNVAVLTWKKGAKDEARNHVRRFLESYPGDPRGAQLTAMVGEAAPQGR